MYKRQVFIDRYDTKKYKNANLCIFGTSGAGKSFYTKLLILRNRLLGIEQYIIDPEREYETLCNNLDVYKRQGFRLAWKSKFLNNKVNDFSAVIPGRTQMCIRDRDNTDDIIYNPGITYTLQSFCLLYTSSI